MIGKAKFYPAQFTTGMRKMFFDIYNETPTQDWSTITTVTQSDKDEEKYGGIGNIPPMHEWVKGDEREILGIGDPYEYAIKNKKYELTLAVFREELEDEQYNLIKQRITDMAQEAKRLKETLIFGMLPAGATTACYDGANFFATTHNINGANQSNKLDTAFSKTALQTAITTMRKYKNDKGNPLHLKPDLLIVNPDLEWTAREVLNASSYVATGVGSTAELSPNLNLLKGSVNLLVSDYLTSSTEWYLATTTKSIKPVILQSRVPLEFASLDDPSDNENAFMRDEYLYGIRERFGLGYGPWYTCIQGNA